MTNHCVTYHRSATAPLGGIDENIEAQKIICEKFAAKNDLIIVEGFLDSGVSGMAPTRKGFDSLLNFLAKRNGDPITLLVSSPSRIAREAALLQAFADKLAGLGVTIQVAGAL